MTPHQPLQPWTYDSSWLPQEVLDKVWVRFDVEQISSQHSNQRHGETTFRTQGPEPHTAHDHHRRLPRLLFAGLQQRGSRGASHLRLLRRYLPPNWHGTYDWLASSGECAYSGYGNFYLCLIIACMWPNLVELHRHRRSTLRSWMYDGFSRLLHARR